MMISELRKFYFLTNSDMSRAISGLNMKIKISPSSDFSGAVATALIGSWMSVERENFLECGLVHR